MATIKVDLLHCIFRLSFDISKSKAATIFNHWIGFELPKTSTSDMFISTIGLIKISWQ